MPREVTDTDGIRWTLNEAYAGLDEEATSGRGEHEVVATPSGGAQSVRLRLSGAWSDLSDDELLERIQHARP